MRSPGPSTPAPRDGEGARTELALVAHELICHPWVPKALLKTLNEGTWRGSGLMNVLEGDAPQLHRVRASCSQDPPRPRPSGHSSARVLYCDLCSTRGVVSEGSPWVL